MGRLRAQKRQMVGFFCVQSYNPTPNPRLFSLFRSFLLYFPFFFVHLDKPTAILLPSKPKPTAILRPYKPKPTAILRPYEPKPTAILQPYKPKPTAILQPYKPKPTAILQPYKPQRTRLYNPRTIFVNSHFYRHTLNYAKSIIAPIIKHPTFC